MAAPRRILIYQRLPADSRELAVTATSNSGEQKRWRVRVRIDTPKEWEYYRHGGILHYAIRQLLD